jgi:FKBP-type peptidyl-prolyl cis-trans isomerase (trigger factor)
MPSPFTFWWEAAIASERKIRKRMTRANTKAQSEQIQARLQQILEEHVDAIGLAMVQKAREGNYNAAQLLLRLGGIDSSPAPEAAAENERQTTRIIFLDIVEQILGPQTDEGREDDRIDS